MVVVCCNQHQAKADAAHAAARLLGIASEDHSPERRDVVRGTEDDGLVLACAEGTAAGAPTAARASLSATLPVGSGGVRWRCGALGCPTTPDFRVVARLQH